MSSSWRYLVRPDGSFTRFGNVNGSLDSVTDEELARIRARDNDEEEQPLPPCSRCEGTLTVGWRGGPLFNPVWMELCPVCDAHRPAVSAFLKWHRDPERTSERLPQLFSDWETETVQAQGWLRITEDETSPDLPPYEGIQTRGQD
ncbi:DUF6300 family protein [Streptomyces scopuliridis]|uniref:DUF6300 family protein n=1 Tax=Streptomyces scopuliridis TaxID=452529 RepID=UPI0036B81142